MQQIEKHEPLPYDVLFTLLSEYGNVKTNSSKRELIGTCPFCNKVDHFYINKTYGKKGQPNAFTCKKCGEEGALYSFLLQLNRLDLYEFGKESLSEFIGDLLQQEEQENSEELSVPTIKSPIGYKRLFESDYLKSRGFTDYDFMKYDIGVTKLKQRLKDYLVFLIKEEDEIKGWVARCTLSRSIIQERGLLRYVNSKTSFSKLLFGFDEIIQGVTKTVICVEGLFDKNSVDNFMNLNDNPEIKCVATFGKRISLVQMLKLKQKGVENLILIFDKDAIKEIKKYASQGASMFKKILCGFVDSKDINEGTEEEFFELIENLVDFKIFDSHYVNVKLYE